MKTNGMAQETAETPQGATMIPGRMTKSRSDRQPILSLVDREYLKSTANTVRGMWEPMSYLYSEADKAMDRVEAMAVPGCGGVTDACKDLEKVAGKSHDPECLEWVREATIKKWYQVIGWLDELLVQSQSVDALRSWQLMSGLQTQGQHARPSAAIMPDFPQPQPPGQEKARSKRGLHL